MIQSHVETLAVFREQTVHSRRYRHVARSFS
jgi:hypothetical protein